MRDLNGLYCSVEVTSHKVCATDGAAAADVAPKQTLALG